MWVDLIFGHTCPLRQVVDILVTICGPSCVEVPALTNRTGESLLNNTSVDPVLSILKGQDCVRLFCWQLYVNPGHPK